MTRAHSNLWTANHSDIFGPVEHALTADVAVIGGGFTGCSAALEAARLGAEVVLLEAKTVAHGGSGRNVGLVNAGLWLPPKEVEARLGQTAGSKLTAALAGAPDLVFDIIQRESIACNATRNGTLHLAHGPSGVKDLESRQTQYQAQSFPTELLSAEDTKARTGSDAFFGAIWDPRAGTIQPGDYCFGLAKAAQAAGARVFTQSPVFSAKQVKGEWELTVGGHQLHAKHLIVATNAYTEHLPRETSADFVTVHYCQFATAPMPQDLQARIFPGKEGTWDTAKVMTSYRVDDAGRFIIGGMGEFGGMYSGIHHDWAKRKMAKVFPELANFEFEHQWNGRIAMTKDYLPKLVNFAPSGWSVFGYSGRGIGPGTLMGTRLAQAILKDQPDLLPLPVLTSYSNNHLPLSEAYYNFGTAMVHATSARV